MGFLDRAIRRGISNVVGEAVDNVVKEQLGVNNTRPSGDNYSQSSGKAFCTSCGSVIDANAAFCTSCGTKREVNGASSVKPYFGDLKIYLEGIIRTEFSDYDVKMNVQPEEFGTNQFSKELETFDFCIYKNGEPAAAIIAIPHNKYKNIPYRGGRIICEQAGIAYLGFYEQMPNDRDYVINRIKEAIK